MAKALGDKRGSRAAAFRIIEVIGERRDADRNGKLPEQKQAASLSLWWFDNVMIKRWLSRTTEERRKIFAGLPYTYRRCRMPDKVLETSKPEDLISCDNTVANIELHLEDNKDE